MILREVLLLFKFRKISLFVSRIMKRNFYFRHIWSHNVRFEIFKILYYYIKYIFQILNHLLLKKPLDLSFHSESKNKFK